MSDRAFFATDSLDGAFYGSTKKTLSTFEGKFNNSASEFLYLDASRSNGLFGDSSTIQPKALTTLFIIKS